MLVALAGLPALADDTDPPTTTEPAPETTTPPDTTPTTDPPPETTVPTDPTTTVPGEPTTTVPGDTTTTAPDTTTTTAPRALPKLDAGEALQARPEFASLSSHQLALVDQVQHATDAYALRRFAQDDLVRQWQAAKDVLDQARFVESAAVTREIVGLVEAGLSADDTLRVTAHRRARSATLDRRLDTFRAVRRRFDAERKDATKARSSAEPRSRTSTRASPRRRSR